MRSKIFFTLAALLVVSASGHAQRGAAGTWAGETQGRGGTQMVTVVLNADGTGTFKQGNQDAQPVSEVKITGDTVSFKRMLAGRGGAGGGVTLTYSGAMAGDTLTLDIAAEGGGRGDGARGGRGGPQQLVLTRQ